MPCRNNLSLGVVKMPHRVAENDRLWIGVAERVPDDIEPVAVAKLRRLIPLVRGESDGLPARPSLHLDATDTFHRIAVPCLRVGWSEAANIETNLDVTDKIERPFILIAGS